MTKVTASKLRENIYRLLDEVLESGHPIEIERKGKRLRIVPADPEPSESRSPKQGRLGRLIKRDCLPEGTESLLGIDWSAEWKP